MGGSLNHLTTAGFSCPIRVIMARVARAVALGIPHHLTHRGNRRETVFFDDDQRRAYCHWLREYAGEHGLRIWAYCLMSNHVHLLAVPDRDEAMARAIGRAHMRHARRVNRERGWRGHLWANRFYSTALDEAHLWRAVKYVELNPVRAGVVARAEDWPWSSARAHAWGEDDALLDPDRPFPAPEKVGQWSAWLSAGQSDEEIAAIRRNTKTGRPCGDESFVTMVEDLLGRILRPQKRGPKPKDNAEQRGFLDGLWDN